VGGVAPGAHLAVCTDAVDPPRTIRRCRPVLDRGRALLVSAGEPVLALGAVSGRPITERGVS